LVDLFELYDDAWTCECPKPPPTKKKKKDSMKKITEWVGIKTLMD
jgi:hypothetical protein